jgi:uncharacterized tellurite resistance protein B-like protein
MKLSPHKKSNEAMRKIVRRIILICMTIDNDIDINEVKMFKQVLDISKLSEISIQGLIKEIKSEGDILILFREELLKIVDPEQQEFIIRILVALIKADNKISKEELNLFNISRNVYTNLNFNDLLLQPSNISSLLKTIED